MSRQQRDKFIAFHNGRLISDHILENIIYAALRGKMTESGESLLLIPDPRIGRPDESGLYKMRSVKKSQCITLKKYVHEFRKSSGVTDIGKWATFTPCQIRALRGKTTPNMSPLGTGTNSTNSSIIRDKCRVCSRDISCKRKGAKFCGSTCRQRAFRSRDSE